MPFVVFLGQRFYPGGGMHDHLCSRDTLSDAKRMIEDIYKSMDESDQDDMWAQVAEISSDGLNLVCEFRRSEWTDATQTPNIETRAIEDSSVFRSVFIDYIDPDGKDARYEQAQHSKRLHAIRSEIRNITARLDKSIAAGLTDRWPYFFKKIEELEEAYRTEEASYAVRS